jgi:hypothetical protein
MLKIPLKKLRSKTLQKTAAISIANQNILNYNYPFLICL